MLETVESGLLGGDDDADDTANVSYSDPVTTDTGL